ncbi:ABC transporter substrate-binding protein [Spirochaeta thermophila]|uniref:ABC transporter substrate-binding protein n=1 Tax=Winmispira thermophila (strain ATCC 49972 / DSM 6192 / RI 19.B1) TaxID=665571 RepID=E0RQ63_WINT6|nr:MqnA/MqnD/SBP family protein [Spirochaeta thermophila]ADN01447.1 hypothetical protein STHERM_c04760 [Spirochaeta thermophila DSM 6192]
MWRRGALVVLVGVLAAGLLPAGGASEHEAVPDEVRLTLFLGPTALGFIPLLEAGEVAGVPLSYELVPQPDVAVSRILAGETDVAALPVNLAARLYNGGADYRMAAMYLWGLLYLVAPEPVTLEGLAGRRVYVPGKGATPDLVFRFLLEKRGVEGVELDYSLPPAGLAQAVAAGKVDYALLPEPFVSRVLALREDLVVAFDLQAEWEREVGTPLTQTCIVVKGEFLQEYPVFWKEVRRAIEESIHQVVADPDGATSSPVVEKLGLTSEIARAAIPRCRLSFVPAREARQAVEAYLGVLLEYAPGSVGGALPPAEWYVE